MESPATAWEYQPSASDTADVSELSMGYWFYNSKSSAIAFDGWLNVHPVSIEYLLNGSVNLQTLDLRGLDPSTILRWNYAFSGMSSLTTILASSSWTLPTAFTTKSNTFYADSKLVGGNGTIFSSSKTSADYAVIDKDGQVGYLTAGWLLLALAFAGMALLASSWCVSIPKPNGDPHGPLRDLPARHQRGDLRALHHRLPHCPAQ